MLVYDLYTPRDSPSSSLFSNKNPHSPEIFYNSMIILICCLCRFCSGSFSWVLVSDQKENKEANEQVTRQYE
jgi:hypothetical protein